MEFPQRGQPLSKRGQPLSRGVQLGSHRGNTFHLQIDIIERTSEEIGSPPFRKASIHSRRGDAVGWSGAQSSLFEVGPRDR